MNAVYELKRIKSAVSREPDELPANKLSSSKLRAWCLILRVILRRRDNKRGGGKVMTLWGHRSKIVNFDG